MGFKLVVRSSNKSSTTCVYKTELLRMRKVLYFDFGIRIVKVCVVFLKTFGSKEVHELFSKLLDSF